MFSLLGGQVERGEAVDVIPHIHHGASAEQGFGHRGMPGTYLSETCKMSRLQAIRAKNTEEQLRMYQMAKVWCYLKIALAI